MPRGFSSFVAWRYLLARPRQASGSIIGFAGLAAFVGLAGMLAALFYPLGRPYLLEPSTPLGLLVAAAIGVAAVPLALFTAVVHAAAFTRPRRLSPGLLHAAGMGLLVAAGVLGLRGHLPAGAQDGLRAVVTEGPGIAYFVPGALAVLLFAGAALVALLQAMSLADRAPGARALYALGWALALLQLLPLSVVGLRDEVVPGLTERAPALVVGSAAVLVAVAAVAAVFGLRRMTGRGRPRGFGVLTLLALGAAAAPVISVWVLDGREAWEEALGFGIRQAPMWMTMPTTIAWAIVGLAIVLGVVRYVFTFFTTVSIGGVCLGSMALVIVLSVMSGFETDLRDKILGADAHILVTKRGDEPFLEYRQIAEKLDSVPRVEAHSPYLQTEVVISSRNNYGNVIIKGIDPETVGDVTDLDENARDPDALARMWPLEEDGSIAGPPPWRRAASEGPEAPEAPDEEIERDAPGTDPAPDDLDVDIDEPVDFSGRGSGEEPDDAPEDPAPGDMDVDVEVPQDFSAPTGDGAGGDGEGEDRPRDGERDQEGPPEVAPGDAAQAPPSPFGAGEGEAAPRRVPGAGPDRDPLGTDLEQFEPLGDEPVTGAELGLPDPFGDPFAPLGGIEPEDRAPPPAIAPEVARLPGVLVGRELIDQVPMQPGDEVTIISPLGQDSPIGPVPRTKLYRVAGEFFTGMYEFDLKYAYVPLYSLQDFLDLGDEVTGIEVRIDNPDRSPQVVADIERALGDGYEVADWRELNRSLFSALQLEKIAMFIVLAIVILVASFSIIGNLVMIVIEKAKEIALLKTLGAGDAGVMRVFVIQGFFIGLVGTSLGVTLGLIVCALGMIYGLPLDPDVYYIDQLPIHVDPASVATVALAGVVISAVATLYPAYLAARLRPVEGLRND